MILKKWSSKTWREFHVSRGSSGEKKMELETRIILEGHQGTKGAKKALELLCKKTGEIGGKTESGGTFHWIFVNVTKGFTTSDKDRKEAYITTCRWNFYKNKLMYREAGKLERDGRTDRTSEIDLGPLRRVREWWGFFTALDDSGKDPKTEETGLQTRRCWMISLSLAVVVVLWS